MDWHDIDRNTPGQLTIPECLKAFSLAEKVFIKMGVSWLECAQSVPNNHPLPRQSEMYALTCLLLAEEWGQNFSEVAKRRIETNIQYATCRREMPILGQVFSVSAHQATPQEALRQAASWYESLPWRLCLDAFSEDKTISASMDELHENLDHHKSDLREWMMEIAWIVFPRLRRPWALSKLYKNIAGTLGGVEMAIGLATRYFKDHDEFNLDASSFVPEKEYASQYFDRIKEVGNIGVLSFQAGYLDLEVKCRKMIEKEILGELVTSLK